MSVDLFRRIQVAYPDLSDAKRRLADFLLEDWQDAAFLSAGRVARRVSCSESVVVRFAGDLGFSGYPEMQDALQDHVKGQLNMVTRLESSTATASSPAEVWEQAWRKALSNVNESIHANSIETLQEVVQEILLARQTMVTGVRMSAALAVFLGLNLNQLLGNVEILSMGQGEYVDRIRGLQSGDVLIVVGFLRYSRWTLEVTVWAKKRGVKVIAITDSLVSPIAQNADLVLVARTEGVSFARSHVAAMTLIDGLLALIAIEGGKRTSESLDELEQVLDNFTFLVPD